MFKDNVQIEKLNFKVYTSVQNLRKNKHNQFFDLRQNLFFLDA